jgi:superfamily II DNA/RNA helicase
LLKDAETNDAEHIKALIISPTRELAVQIYKVAHKMSESLGKVSVKCAFGKSGNKINEYTHNGQNILVISYDSDYDSRNAR